MITSFSTVKLLAHYQDGWGLRLVWQVFWHNGKVISKLKPCSLEIMLLFSLGAQPYLRAPFWPPPLHEVQSCVQQWRDSVTSYNPNKVMEIYIIPLLQNTQHSSAALTLRI